MTQTYQLADDLQFVRKAVEMQNVRSRPPRIIYWMWATYVIIGYSLIDFARHWASPFFIIGAIIVMAASWYFRYQASQRGGVIDRADNRRHMLGWSGGIILAILSVYGLAFVIPALREMAGTQVLVVIFGIMYFQTGVWGPPFLRYLIWGGPTVIVGGICVSLLPHYGWTGVGVLIASCILLPTFGSRQMSSGVIPAIAHD